MSNLRKWADEHQYDAEAQPNATEHMGVMPSVHLLEMPDDPLGVLAAQNAIYKGKVVRNLADVTDKERHQALDDMLKTTLQSPLESIKMHFVIEGVDRAFTHQLVRQRTANFGQESLRFSVMGELIDATTLPPDLMATKRTGYEVHALSMKELSEIHSFKYASAEERNRMVWDWTIMQVDKAYHMLVEGGMAAEEARGLLPHCTATRLHWQLDMRALMKTMGERLCTQAQFHWKLVANLVRDAIRHYTPDFSWASYDERDRIADEWAFKNRWQFVLIADSGLFRPVCYQTGKCMFQASADRGCTIRERVDRGAFNEISDHEWALDPAAARETL